MRLMKQFFDVLQQLVNNFDPNEKNHFEQQLNELCERFFGNDISFYLEDDDVDIVDKLEAATNQELVAKASMLADLMYHRIAVAGSGKARANLAAKTLRLLSYVNGESNTYSFERLSRIAEMEQLIS